MSAAQSKLLSDPSVPIHVLFIADQLCEPGGAERMLLNTIRWLPKDRFRCSLITFKIDPTVELFANLPCPHYVFPLKKTYDGNALRVAAAIRKFIQRENVAIVQTFHETSDLWAGLIAKLSGATLVSSRRDMGIQRDRKHQVGYRVMNPLFDLVLAVSEQVRGFCVAKDRTDPAKVRTLYNGLELDKLSLRKIVPDLRTQLGAAAGTLIVATVGHVKRVKGIDILVEAAAVVAGEFPNVIFLVIGRKAEGQLLQQLESRIAELGLQKNIKFYGESQDVGPLLQCCDIFFLPSRSEGFSNALIEAMARALPCVASDVGGNSEAIEESRSGYLFENEDAPAAADRILRLLRAPGSAREMGLRGKEIVGHRFTAKIMMEQLIGHYERLLKKRSR